MDVILTGMSPSQTASPLASLSDHEGNTKEQRGDHSSPGIVGIRTPPVPNIAPLDPDHRSPRPGSMTLAQSYMYSVNPVKYWQ